MSQLGFILASAALVCAAPEGRDTRPRARTPPGPSTYCGQGYRCRGSGRAMRCHPDAACDDRELRSGPCAVAAACLEECVSVTSDVGIAVSSSEVGFQVAKRVLDGFDFAVALERMDERAARKLSGLLGTTVSFPHHRARAGASGGFNRRAAAVPTSIRDRILREHDVDVRLHAWLAARDP